MRLGHVSPSPSDRLSSNGHRLLVRCRQAISRIPRWEGYTMRRKNTVSSAVQENLYKRQREHERLRESLCGQEGFSMFTFCCFLRKIHLDRSLDDTSSGGTNSKSRGRSEDDAQKRDCQFSGRCLTTAMEHEDCLQDDKQEFLISKSAMAPFDGRPFRVCSSLLSRRLRPPSYFSYVQKRLNSNRKRLLSWVNTAKSDREFPMISTASESLLSRG